jgi:hypothetical protein
MFTAIATLVSAASSSANHSAASESSPGNKSGSEPSLDSVGKQETLSDHVTEHGLTKRLPDGWKANLTFAQDGASDFAEVIVVSHYSLPHQFELRPKHFADPMGETAASVKSSPVGGASHLTTTGTLKEAFKHTCREAQSLSTKLETSSRREVAGSQYQPMTS